MTWVTRPMTEAEYEVWLGHAIELYGHELAESGRATPEAAQAESARQFAELLPDGVNTEGMVLLAGESEGEVVGRVWVSMPRPPDRPDSAWVYNVEVEPEHRGKGYGRALMRAAEAETTRRGVAKIGLNVFGGNDVAINLYESLGYRVTAQQMTKPLPSQP